MTTQGDGLLAIWSTVAADFETDYLHWLTREHVFERVGISGFLSGTVYRRRDSSPSEFLILYALEHASVMSSDAYRARLDAPTPWTQRVMPQLQQFRRGGGTVQMRAGHAYATGGRLAVARFDTACPALSPDLLDRVAALDRVTQVRLMTVASDATSISTREKSMRSSSSEGAFAGILAIDALDDTARDHAAAALAEALSETRFEYYDPVFIFARPHA